MPCMPLGVGRAGSGWTGHDAGGSPLALGAPREGLDAYSAREEGIPEPPTRASIPLLATGEMTPATYEEAVIQWYELVGQAGVRRHSALFRPVLPAPLPMSRSMSQKKQGEGETHPSRTLPHLPRECDPKGEEPRGRCGLVECRSPKGEGVPCA